MKVFILTVISTYFLTKILLYGFELYYGKEEAHKMAYNAGKWTRSIFIDDLIN